MLRQVPGELRLAFEALFRIDAAMGDVVARSAEPALAAVKLAWWRERLEDLDSGVVAAEPRLRATAEHLLPRSISGCEIAALEDGWATLLEERVDPERIKKRGAQLFRLGARLLGGDDERIGDAGALYALVSVGRRGVPQLFEHAAGPRKALAKHRFSSSLRPLSALARLAVRDLEQGSSIEQEGSPPRLAAILRHRWSGVVTRGN